jgi:hypothetical protein
VIPSWPIDDGIDSIRRERRMRQTDKARFDRVAGSLGDEDLDAVTGGGGFDALLDPGGINGETECAGAPVVRYFIGMRKLT